MQKPEEIAEWEEYVAMLAGPVLTSQTDTANSQTFIDAMAEEGKDSAWCKHILVLFVRQCRATGSPLPSGGMWDLDIIAMTDEIASMGVQMSEEEAAELAAAYEPLDFDQDID